MRSCSVLLLAIAVGAADPAPVVAWSVNATAAQALLRQEPFAVVLDPRCAPVTAHVLNQARMLAAGDRHVPPFLELMQADAIRLWGWMPADVGQSRWSKPDLGMRIDGAIAGIWGRWFSRNQNNGERAKVAGITGTRSDEGYFLGFDDRHWIGAMGPRGERALAEAGPAHTGIFLSLDATAVIPAIAAASSERDAAEADAVMPKGWRTWTPRLAVVLDTTQPVFTGSGTLRGTPGLPLATIDPGLARMIPSGAEFALAVAVEPSWLRDLAPILAKEGFQKRQRPSVLAIGTALTGQAALWGSWSAGPIPEVTLVLGLDPATAATLDTALPAVIPDLSTAEVAGAKTAWSCSLPFGSLTIARGADRLVVALDAGVGLAAMPEPAAAPATVSAASLWLRVDTKTIGAHWLPTAWALAQAQKEVLGNDPLQTLRQALQSVDEGVVDGTPSGLLISNEDDWKAQGIHAAFGDSQAIDGKIAVWRQADGHAVAVIRVAESGWQVIARQGRDVRVLDADGLAKALAGAVRIAGPESPALVITPIPEQAAFDRRWLPPVDVVVDHLRPWEITLTGTVDGLTYREQGLCGFTALAIAGAHGLWIAGGEALSRAARNQAQARESVLRTQRPDLMAAVDQIQGTIRSLSPNQLPKNASGLVAQGLELDRLGALWGDGQVGPATDLDRMGRWTPNTKDPQAPLWLIRIDDTQAVSISRWSVIAIIPAPADLPARPASGERPVPMAP